MYEKLPNLVIGFHGCSKETYEAVIAKHEELKASSNTYDWLGNGIYFWENNLARAKEWAERRYGEEASVLGAVLVFPGSAILAKTHIQICIYNPNCIKGYFEPRDKNALFRLP